MSQSDSQKIEELQRLLEQARRENERAQREMEEARHENEKTRRETEQTRRETEQNRREMEEIRHENKMMQRKLQKSTLTEYLYNCHYRVYNKLILDHRVKPSTGLPTRVDGKFYPKWLRPWNAFANYQRQRYFEEISRACGEERLFNQETTSRDLGDFIAGLPAKTENDIDRFESRSVEEPTRAILGSLWRDNDLRQQYQCNALIFLNNIPTLLPPEDDIPTSDIIQQPQIGSSKQSNASTSGFKIPKLRPDGWGIRVELNNEHSVAFVYDFKAAHKFSVKYVKAALTNEQLFMKVTQLVNSDKYSTDDDLRLKERNEVGIAMAMTQVFNYMIWYGVVYGYVAAGKVLVLLHFDRADPQTLYYHLCIPEKDVGIASVKDQSNLLSHTAVAQLASFSLLSLGSQALRDNSLEASVAVIKEKLAIWGQPYEDSTHVEIESTSSPEPTSPPGSEDPDFISSESPAKRKYALRSSSSCKTATVLSRDSDHDEPDRSQDDLRLERAKTNALKRKADSSHTDENTETSEWAPNRSYCTQACLLGLKNGGNLDSNCPNVLLHRAQEDSTRHPISLDEFNRLIGEQLYHTPYRGCRALDREDKRGAIGILFKIDLALYGYAFVAKGTLAHHLSSLEHESIVYARLARLQGKVIPVYLGIIRLHPGYLLPGGARITCMMLMSWAGEEAPGLKSEKSRSWQEVFSEGVYQGDERDPNMVWNDECQRFMVIDFNEAIFLPAPKNKQLSKLMGGKRKRSGDARGHKSKRIKCAQDICGI
ncbi:hypothetical protein CDD81_3691 [Ophiocordyceps australis]|uniref:Metalloprotease m41 ftsh n=1 Tax=Ophiocordyceps australis TaxID=1399860 RepID=A0A2C5XUM6_9HYPO|nr:hypothetical protein CDD81_3691 [Ophiocordyceps australis]